MYYEVIPRLAEVLLDPNNNRLQIEEAILDEAWLKLLLSCYDHVLLPGPLKQYPSPLASAAAQAARWGVMARHLRTVRYGLIATKL